MPVVGKKKKQASPGKAAVVTALVVHKKLGAKLGKPGVKMGKLKGAKPTLGKAHKAGGAHGGGCDCCAACAGVGAKAGRILGHLRTLGAAHAKGALTPSVVTAVARASGKTGAVGRTPGGSGKAGRAFYDFGLGDVYNPDDDDFDDSGLAGLGELTPGDWFPSMTDITAADQNLDRLINAFLADIARAAGRLPATFLAQVDDYVTNWRKIHDTWYVLEKTRADAIMDMQAQFNRLRAQFLSYGVGSTSANTSTVSIEGRDVDADKAVPPPGLLKQLENMLMWGAVLVGGVAVLKVSSDLGVFKKLGGLLPGKAATT